MVYSSVMNNVYGWVFLTEQKKLDRQATSFRTTWFLENCFKFINKVANVLKIGICLVLFFGTG